MKIEKIPEDQGKQTPVEMRNEKSKEYSRRKENRKVDDMLYENVKYKLYIKKHGAVELIESARIGENLDKKT
jgi:hypothetical protein